MMFSDTPIVDHDWLPFVESRSTRVTAPVSGGACARWRAVDGRIGRHPVAERRSDVKKFYIDDDDWKLTLWHKTRAALVQGLNGLDRLSV